MDTPSRTRGVLRHLGTALPFLLVLVARTSFANHYEVPTGSMEPTLAVGDRIFVDMRAYGVRVPLTEQWLSERETARGEVVAFTHLVTLDLRGKRLVLERPVARGALVGATGIHIAPGSWEVTFVDAGSPAAKAGVLVGDRLVSVDGRRLGALESIVAQRVLASFAGESARLELDRKGRVFKVRFSRPSEFDLPVGALRGVGFDKQLDGDAVVAAVDPGSPAAKAGLRVGDTIVSVNGVGMATLRPGELGWLLMQPEAALSVKREGEAATLPLALTSPRAAP